MVKNDSYSLVRFSNFSEEFRQTNCGVPLRIYCPTMLKWKSRHMTCFAEEKDHHSVGSDFFRKQLLFDMARVQRPTRWTVASFRAHMHRSMIRHLIKVFWGTGIVFFQHLFTPIDTNLFLSDCQIVRDTTGPDVLNDKLNNVMLVFPDFTSDFDLHQMFLGVRRLMQIINRMCSFDWSHQTIDDCLI